MADSILKGWDMIGEVSQVTLNLAAFALDHEGIIPPAIDYKEDTPLSSGELQAQLQDPQVSFQSQLKEGVQLRFPVVSGTLSLQLHESVSFPINGCTLTINARADYLTATRGEGRMMIIFTGPKDDTAGMGGEIDGLAAVLPDDLKPYEAQISDAAAQLITQFLHDNLDTGKVIDVAHFIAASGIPEALIPHLVEFNVLQDDSQPGLSSIMLLTSLSGMEGQAPANFTQSTIPAGANSATTFSTDVFINQAIVPAYVKAMVKKKVDISTDDFTPASNGNPATMSKPFEYSGATVESVAIGLDEDGTRFDIEIKGNKKEKLAEVPFHAKFEGHIYLTPAITDNADGTQSLGATSEVPEPKVTVPETVKLTADIAAGVTGSISPLLLLLDKEHDGAEDLKKKLTDAVGDLKNQYTWGKGYERHIRMSSVLMLGDAVQIGETLKVA